MSVKAPNVGDSKISLDQANPTDHISANDKNQENSSARPPQPTTALNDGSVITAPKAIKHTTKSKNPYTIFTNIQAPQLRVTGLPILPLEIQLKILQTCITASPPLIEITGPYGFGCCPDKTHEPWRLALGILRTCRLYWIEGSKMFFSSNRFMLRALRTCPAAVVNAGAYASMLPHLKHVVLKYECFMTYGCAATAARDISRTASQLPLLETLPVETETDHASFEPISGCWRRCPAMKDLLSAMAPHSIQPQNSARLIPRVTLVGEEPEERDDYEEVLKRLHVRNVQIEDLEDVIATYLFPLLWLCEKKEGIHIEEVVEVKRRSKALSRKSPESYEVW